MWCPASCQLYSVLSTVWCVKCGVLPAVSCTVWCLLLNSSDATSSVVCGEEFLVHSDICVIVGSRYSDRMSNWEEVCKESGGNI